MGPEGIQRDNVSPCQGNHPGLHVRDFKRFFSPGVLEQFPGWFGMFQDFVPLWSAVLVQPVPV